MSGQHDAAVLKLDGICAQYGDLQVLHGVSLEVHEGEIVTLVGANGAGKTTTINAISGLVACTEGSISSRASRSGSGCSASARRAPVWFRSRRAGGCFAFMTVRENIDLGCYTRGPGSEKRHTLERVLALFPVLKTRLQQLAGTLSGGEQQMLAIARGLMALPRLLVLDEPTLGLAPRLVAQVFETIRAINRQGVTILLVEQNVRHALRLANRGYVLENGRVVLAGSGAELLDDERLKRAYLGL